MCIKVLSMYVNLPLFLLAIVAMDFEINMYICNDVDINSRRLFCLYVCVVSVNICSQLLKFFFAFSYFKFPHHFSISLFRLFENFC